MAHQGMTSSNVIRALFSLMMMLFAVGLSMVSYPLTAQSWEPLASGSVVDPSINLNDVFFTDRETGWIVGDQGTILKTVDGGGNWSQQASPTDQWFNAVYFVDSLTGWITGYGTLLGTKNGGETWHSLISSSDMMYLSVHFADSLTGWITTGEPYDHSSVLKTIDGGKTWNSTLFFRGTYVALSFINAQTGWTLSTRYQEVLQTIDGGETWTSLAQLGGVLLSDIYFADSLTGWLVGGFYEGVILKTTNGGLDWTEQALGVEQPLEKVHFVDDQTGWAAGVGGLVLHTSDGGQTWIEQTSNTSHDLNSIYLSDAEQGCAVGDQGTILQYNPQQVTGEENEVRSDQTLSLFPNPVGRDLYLSWPTLSDEAGEITLYTVTGQPLIQTLFLTGQKPPLQLNVANLSGGLYLLKVKTRTKNMTRLLIKE